MDEMLELLGEDWRRPCVTDVFIFSGVWNSCSLYEPG